MDPQRHLMFAPDSPRREDIVTDLGIAIIAEGGVRALTTRTVADRCGCTRQAIHQWFGGPEALRHVVARGFGVRWERWIRARIHADGLAGLLADGAEVIEWTRVWLALVEHAPRDARVAAVVDAMRYSERAEIGVMVGREGDSDAVALVHSVTEGLRLALCAPEPTLSVERAVRILRACAEGVALELLDVKQVHEGGSAQAPDVPVGRPAAGHVRRLEPAVEPTGSTPPG